MLYLPAGNTRSPPLISIEASEYVADVISKGPRANFSWSNNVSNLFTHLQPYDTYDLRSALQARTSLHIIGPTPLLLTDDRRCILTLQIATQIHIFEFSWDAIEGYIVVPCPVVFEVIDGSYVEGGPAHFALEVVGSRLIDHKEGGLVLENSTDILWFLALRLVRRKYTMSDMREKELLEWLRLRNASSLRASV